MVKFLSGEVSESFHFFMPYDREIGEVSFRFVRWDLNAAC